MANEYILRNGVKVLGNIETQTLRITTGATAGYFLTTDGSGNATWAVASGGGTVSGNGVTASGTASYIAKFTGTNTLGNSIIYDSGSSIGINTSSPAGVLDVNGNVYFRNNVYIDTIKSVYFNYDALVISSALIFKSRGEVGSAYTSFQFDTPNQITTTGSNIFSFANNGSYKMVMDRDGLVGIGTSSPTASALLEISSTQSGFLPPRMSSSNRDGIASPATGLMIYNTTTNAYNLYNGSTWSAMTATSDLDNIKLSSVGITIDGQGGTITTGNKGYVVVPYSGTITGWEIFGDVSGSIVVDVWSTAYCVDEETEILTYDGYKKYTELKQGELILSYNPIIKKSEWKPIDFINIFDYNGPIFKLGGDQFGAMVTPNHRWLVEKKHGRSPKKELNTYCIKETAYLGRSSSESLVIGGPHMCVDEKTYSDDFVKICAWYYTEGSLRKNNLSITISQSFEVNPENCKMIEESLIKIGSVRVYGNKDGLRNKRAGNRGSNRRMGLYHNMRTTQSNNCIVYELTGTIVDNIIYCIEGKDKIPSYEFIRSLTADQLELFIETSILGDGIDNMPQFTQCHKERMDRFQIICVLAGYSPRISSDYRLLSLRRRQTGVKMNNIHLNSMDREILPYFGKVWCPTVENGLWFARRNGTSFITGNSSYPPTVSNTIAGSEKPTLSSQTKNQDLTLTTWTTTVTAGDIIAFNVDSATTVSRVNLSILITKS